MIEKTNLELTETVKMLPGKNHSKNPRSKVIFESENGKENTKNPSIYIFSAGPIQAVGLKEIDGWVQILWDAELGRGISILLIFPQFTIQKLRVAGSKI